MERYKNGGNLSMNYTDGYIEIQLHGELVVARDVVKIMISTSNESKDEVETLLKAYFEKIGHSISYDFIY